MSSFEQKSATPASSASQQPSSTTAATSSANMRLPGDLTLQHATKIAISDDKPIMLDYWFTSLEKKSCIGVRESGEKLLVKSAEEYTSPIAKLYKSGTEFIIITENSIYLVAGDIPTKKIT
jgi:hypothetical protein